ncbi:MAG: MATE family efflux transporter [Pseudomonadota bacterium]
MADTQTAQTPLTHARLLRIAVPIVLSNSTVPLLGAVDTAVVGQMGAAAPIGAVGIGAIILSSLYWLFAFLRMGTIGLASQARGANDQAEEHVILTRCMIIGMLGGALMILLQWPLFYGAFVISPASAEVETLARDYLAIRIWSAPALISLYGVTGWLIAQERTGAVLALQLAMNGLNIALNIWFVLGLEMGVTGVAWATFLAEWAGLILGLWFCRGVFRGPHWRNRERVLARAPLMRMALINRDILLRSLFIQVIFVSFLFFSGDLGDVTLAANQVLLQFVFLTAYGLDGFAHAVETLIGQAIGGRDRAGLRRAAKIGFQWALLVALLITLAFASLGTQIIALMATSEAVRAAAGTCLIYVIATPLASVWSFMIDGIFVGATRARDMRDTMVMSAVLYLICAAALLPLLGNHGLWIALLISFGARALTLGLRYRALEREAFD